jgi:hypothetical protein
MASDTSQHQSQNDESADPNGCRTSAEPAPKRVKRGKYVGRACAQCQRRKIRCEGGSPCAQCAARNIDCATGSRATASTTTKGSGRAELAATANSKSASSVAIDTDALLNRLISVERQLSAVLSNKEPSSNAVYVTPEQSAENAASDRGSPEPPHLASEERQVFVGEPSMLHALRNTEARLEDPDGESEIRSEVPNRSPLTPKPFSTLNASAEKSSRSWLRTMLLSYGIVPVKQQWMKFLEIFFLEVHVLYPFLHPPTVRETHEQLWDSSLFLSYDDLSHPGDENKVSTALLFLCLATGRCTVSSRVDDVEGRHSAGWSLYSVAMYLLRDVLDLTQDHKSTLQSTQALTLMVRSHSYIVSLRPDALDSWVANGVSGCVSVSFRRK